MRQDSIIVRAIQDAYSKGGGEGAGYEGYQQCGALCGALPYLLLLSMRCFYCLLPLLSCAIHNMKPGRRG